MSAMQVYDVVTGKLVTVTVAEAQAGLIRYARSLGPGTPACAEWERKAIEFGRLHREDERE
jgi:hypothetical protein